MKKLIEKLIPFTLIVSKSPDAKIPEYIKPRIIIQTKHRKIVIAKKIKNIYE